MVYYPNPINAGLETVASLGDGETIAVRWWRAYPSSTSNKIAYHIYCDTNESTLFHSGVKLVALGSTLEANVKNLIPGQLYFFSVRAVEYSPLSDYEETLIPIYDDLYILPETYLSEDIDANQLNIPVISVENFRSSGVLKIGTELIQYDSINGNNFILSSINQRGYNSTRASRHGVDGYDGYNIWQQIIQPYFNEFLEADRVFICQSRFQYPNHPYTLIDGYAQVTKDILSTDLSVSDEKNIDFPAYDYSGYHRTDPVDLLNGLCVGSYIGGEQGCIDKYGNVNMVRGFSLQDRNNQLQEMLINSTGRVAVLLRRQQTGILCACYESLSEYPDDRCPKCGGTKFASKYEQYFYPRSSDGRIRVRLSPADEALVMKESGFESEMSLEMWTLTDPTIKTKDVIVLFDLAGNEEFRYEVIKVGRNNLLQGNQGAQKLSTQRIRKTDPVYQIRIFGDTSKYPQKLTTTIGFVEGIPPHVHEITRNEHDPSTWSQMTSVSQGHNHYVVFKNGNLIVQDDLGHHHDIVL